MSKTIKPRHGSGPKKRSRRPRPTIALVAAKAKVAPATVSGVLNERPDCYASEKTRQRVLDAANRLGYRPNPMARALLGKSTATLGLVVPGFDVDVTSQKFTGFETAARFKGNLTIACETRNEPDLEDQAIRWLLDRYVDGIAVYPTEHGKHTELRRLVKDGFPVVTFDGKGRVKFEIDDVSVNCYGGGRLLAEHLIECGRKNVVILNGRLSCYVVDQKIKGIKEVFAEQGLPEPRCTNLKLDTFSMRHWQTEELSHVADALNPLAGTFDAIVGAGDLLAATGMRVCSELGLKVPEDVAVAGYDGCAFSGQLVTPLTTVYHDSEDIGRIAFELLDRRMTAGEQDLPLEQVTSEPQLIVRASTRGKHPKN